MKPLPLGMGSDHAANLETRFGPEAVLEAVLEPKQLFWPQ